jgi:hypothetical protein
MPAHRSPTRSRSPLRLALALLVGAASLACAASRASAEEISADAVKATFLYKFVPFVGWPAATFPSPNTPVHICIVGDDPFGPNIERAIAAQTLGPRPIVVTKMPVARPHAGCQVMYIGGSDAQSVGQALKVVRGEPVLTVTDDSAPKGVIDFDVVGGRVRFKIDEQSAAENGLQIRATLLSLAITVTRERKAQ